MGKVRNEDEDYELIHEDRFFLHPDRLDAFRSYLEVHLYPERKGQRTERYISTGFILSEENVGHFCLDHSSVNDPKDLDDVVEGAEKIVAGLQGLIETIRAYQKHNPLAVSEAEE